MTKSIHEQTAIRVDNAEASTTAAPTVATDGIKVPSQFRKHWEDVRVHLHIQKVKAGGAAARTYRVKLHGYISTKHTLTEGTLPAQDTTTPIASSGFWSCIGDTDTRTDAAADFAESWLFYGAASFERLATEIVTNAEASVSSSIGFEVVGKK